MTQVFLSFQREFDDMHGKSDNNSETKTGVHEKCRSRLRITSWSVICFASVHHYVVCANCSSLY